MLCEFREVKLKSNHRGRKVVDVSSEVSSGRTEYKVRPKVEAWGLTCSMDTEARLCVGISERCVRRVRKPRWHRDEGF